MRKMLMILLAMVMLSGCASYSSLAKIEKGYGPPARVEIECVENVVCKEDTYYTNKSAVKYVFWFYYYYDWRNLQYCWEIKADNSGKVISHRQYYEQAVRPKSRIPIQKKDGRGLPGVE